MNWKNRLTNYNFWVSIVSAILLILQALKIKVDFIYVNEVSTAVLGLLVVIGIINDPTKSAKTSKSLTDEQPNQTEKVDDNSGQESQVSEEIKISESEQKFLEIAKNEAKNAKILENSSEKAENLKNFSQIDENLAANANSNDKQIEADKQAEIDEQEIDKCHEIENQYENVNQSKIDEQTEIDNQNGIDGFVLIDTDVSTDNSTENLLNDDAAKKHEVNQIPTDHQNEGVDVDIQTNLSVDEIEPKPHVFKIVN